MGPRPAILLLTGLATAAASPSPNRSAVIGMRAFPVGAGTKAVDERRNPWVAVTDATVGPLLTPTQRRIHRRRRVVVDYDADGVPDVAWMVRNRKQMGVLVRLGASGRILLAYRANGKWSDQQLYRAGRRAIEIEFPEAAAVLLSSESGQPMVYYSSEAD